MANVLERQETLYDQDLLAWTEQQVMQLRAGELDRLDLEHLIEELDAMAGRLRRELEATARAAYPQARKRAAIKTGLARATFPADLPYDLGQILDDKGEADELVAS
jgi:hypothetical protein